MQVAVRMAVTAAALSTALALTACGSDQPKSDSGSTKKPAASTETAAAPAADALVHASCAPDAQGEGFWSATGAVKNRTKRVQSYDVIVQVGPANGQESAATVQRVSKVAPGKTEEFAVNVVKTQSTAGPCHIQVKTAKQKSD